MSELGPNPVLRAFPLHVRLGSATGIPRGTARCRSSQEAPLSSETLRLAPLVWGSSFYAPNGENNEAAHAALARTLLFPQTVKRGYC